MVTSTRTKILLPVLAVAIGGGLFAFRDSLFAGNAADRDAGNVFRARRGDMSVTITESATLEAAKSVVAAGLAKRCIVQVSYAIGVPEPLSVFVDTYETGSRPDAEILALVNKKFDFRAGMIGEHLDLKRGVVGGKRGRYLKTAAYGHFGRDDQDVFTWEKVIPLLD